MGTLKTMFKEYTLFCLAKTGFTELSLYVKYTECVFGSHKKKGRLVESSQGQQSAVINN